MNFGNCINLLIWYMRGFSDLIVLCSGMGLLAACPYIVRAIVDRV